MRAAAACLVWASALACACGGQGGGTSAAPVRDEGGEPWKGSLAPRPAGAQVVVAEVDGEPIWDVDVARYAAAHGLDARSAALELVDAHLLAREALARGLADDPEVREARKAERVRALLAADFERSFDGPEDVSRAELDAAWEDPKVRYYFDHARYHRVAWARIPVKKDADPGTVENARAKAEELRAFVAAKRPRTAKGFHKAVRKWTKAEGRKKKLPAGQHPATTGIDTDPDFAKIAFSIDEVGELALGRTQWGWDVMLLYEIIPEVHKDRAAADPELRELLFEVSRQRAFKRWMDALAGRHRVVRHDERLKAVTITAGDEL